MNLRYIHDNMYYISSSLHNLLNYILKDKFEFKKSALLEYTTLNDLFEDNMVFEVFHSNYPNLIWTHISSNGYRYDTDDRSIVGTLKTCLNLDLMYKVEYR